MSCMLFILVLNVHNDMVIIIILITTWKIDKMIIESEIRISEKSKQPKLDPTDKAFINERLIEYGL